MTKQKLSLSAPPGRKVPPVSYAPFVERDREPVPARSFLGGAIARLTVYRLARSIMLDAQRVGDRKTRDSMLGIVLRERAELRKQGVRTESPHAYLRSHKPRDGWPKATALRDAPRRKPREQEVTSGEDGSDV